MNKEETCFIGKMMLDEIMELFATVLPPSEAKAALKRFVDERCDASIQPPLVLTPNTYSPLCTTQQGHRPDLR